MSLVINYPHIAAMVFSQPLYATHDLLQAVKSVLEPRLLGKLSAVDAVPELSAESEGKTSAGVKVVSRIAIIPVHGILVARSGQIDNTCSELVSYEKLRVQIKSALDHELVDEIILDFHTGGGSAMGCKELADYIRASTQQKPITALVNFAACSAGYFLASACSKVIASPTAITGSIGVIMETYEVSRAEDEAGITFSTFYRGEHKNDNSPHEPITDQSIIEINKKLDEMYQLFTQSVADYRGIDVQAVIDTQARVYSSAEALALNLIDEIAPAQDAINTIAAKYRSTRPANSIRAQASAMNQTCQL